MPRRSSYDRWLFFTAALLVLGGLMMVGSSSNYIAMHYGMDPSAFWARQAIHVVLGIALLFGASRVPARWLNSGWVVALGAIASFVLLLVVLAMPSAGGAHRWLPVGPFRVQPSEFVKLYGVLFMAYVLARKEPRVNEPGAVLIPCGAVIGALAFLVCIEPDLGTALMLIAVSCAMLFVAGLGWSWVALSGVLAGLFGTIGVLAEPYRLARIKGWVAGWIHPAADNLGINYQLQQSLLAIGSGGATGVGLGQGQQKAYYVPASHTDFIFSVIGEELGLIGTGLVLAAFLVIFWRGVRSALRAPDRFGFYMALGLTTLLVLQAFVNMAVCVGLLPTKGLPLPLISYGGSSLLASMLAVGLLLNVSQHSN